MANSSLSHKQKEAKKKRKKARHQEELWKKNGNQEHLQKRDMFNDEADTLEKHHQVDMKRKRNKEQEKNKTDDQIMNEFQKMNRKEKFQRLQDADEKELRMKRLAEKREETRENIRKQRIEREENEKKENEEREESFARFKEKKDEFIKEYMEKNPKKNNSEAHKEFIRIYQKEYEEAVEAFNYKNSIISKMMDELNITEEQAHDIFKATLKHQYEKEVTVDESHLIEDVSDPVQIEEFSPRL